MPNVQTNTSATAPAPGLNRFEFHCDDCDRVEFSQSPDLPEGWTAADPIETDHGIAYAWCEDCSARNAEFLAC